MTHLDEHATDREGTERVRDAAGENAASAAGVDNAANSDSDAAARVEAAATAEPAAITETTETTETNEFQQLKGRLEEIAAAVESDDISLDAALDLYEEAVALGLQAIEVLDVDITAQEEEQARMLEDEAVSEAAPAPAAAAPAAPAHESTPARN